MGRSVNRRTLCSAVVSYEMTLGEQLYAAHEFYGDMITEYCEKAYAKGEYVSRGECWDMANGMVYQLLHLAGPK